MLIQTRQISDILRGRDSGWSTQQRTHRAVSWATLFRHHLWHMIAGTGVTVALVYVSLPLLAWMSPTLVGLVLAVPISALSGSVTAASLLRKLNLLRIPEEASSPDVMSGRETARADFEDAVTNLTLKDMVDDERLARRHFDAVATPPAAPRGSPDLAHAGAALKIADAADPDEALGWLSSQEQMALLRHEDLFIALLSGATCSSELRRRCD